MAPDGACPPLSHLSLRAAMSGRGVSGRSRSRPMSISWQCCGTSKQPGACCASSAARRSGAGRAWLSGRAGAAPLVAARGPQGKTQELGGAGQRGVAGIGLGAVAAERAARDALWDGIVDASDCGSVGIGIDPAAPRPPENDGTALDDQGPFPTPGCRKRRKCRLAMPRPP